MNKTIFIPVLDFLGFCIAVFYCFVKGRANANVVYMEVTNKTGLFLKFFVMMDIQAIRATSSRLRHKALNSAHEMSLNDARHFIYMTMGRIERINALAVEFSMMKNLPKFFLSNFYRSMAIQYNADAYLASGSAQIFEYPLKQPTPISIKFGKNLSSKFYYNKFCGRLLANVIKAIFRLLMVHQKRITKVINKEIDIKEVQKSCVVIRKNSFLQGVINEPLFNEHCIKYFVLNSNSRRQFGVESKNVQTSLQNVTFSFRQVIKLLVPNIGHQNGPWLLRILVYLEALFIHRVSETIQSKLPTEAPILFINNSESYDFVSAAISLVAAQENRLPNHVVSTSWSCWPHVSIYGKRLSGGVFLGFANKQLCSLRRSKSVFAGSQICEDALIDRARQMFRAKPTDRSISLCVIDNVSGADLYVSGSLIQETIKALSVLSQKHKFSNVTLKSKNKECQKPFERAVSDGLFCSTQFSFHSTKQEIDPIFSHDFILNIGSSTPGIMGALLGMPTIDLIEEGMDPYFRHGEVPWYQACYPTQLNDAFFQMSKHMLVDKNTAITDPTVFVSYLSAQLDNSQVIEKI